MNHSREGRWSFETLSSLLSIILLWRGQTSIQTSLFIPSTTLLPLTILFRKGDLKKVKWSRMQGWHGSKCLLLSHYTVLGDFNLLLIQLFPHRIPEPAFQWRTRWTLEGDGVWAIKWIHGPLVTRNGLGTVCFTGPHRHLRFGWLRLKVILFINALCKDLESMLTRLRRPCILSGHCGIELIPGDPLSPPTLYLVSSSLFCSLTLCWEDWSEDFITFNWLNAVF